MIVTFIVWSKFDSSKIKLNVLINEVVYNFGIILDKSL